MNLLFVTWDGPQTSYLQGLFGPIFAGLQAQGHQISIIQFSWADAKVTQQRQTYCQSMGFNYQALSVWRRPSAALGSLATAIWGAGAIRQAIKRWQIDVVMPRSTLPALSCLSALKGKYQRPMIFDADGLALDEKVDFDGLSTQSLSYRIQRDIEAQAVRKAQVVLTRAKKASQVLWHRAGADVCEDKFVVVTNGRDSKRFAPIASRSVMRAKLGLPQEALILVYAGSLGPQYCLQQMWQLFENIEHRSQSPVHLLLLTGSPEYAQMFFQEQDIGERVTVLSVAPDQVPKYLACSDLGLALRQPSFSMQAVAPIKLGEYLLCGLPVVATAEVGDTRGLDEQVAFLLYAMDEYELAEASTWFCEQLEQPERVRQYARKVGLHKFSLQASIASYQAALERVTP